jgi:peptidoglycan/LPS O-acetylase OafA/YrhL
VNSVLPGEKRLHGRLPLGGDRAGNGSGNNGPASGNGLSSEIGPAVGTGPALRPGGYLTMVDFCRVVVCFSVVFQHSFLWADMTGNFTGSGFVTMLHFTRDSFFVLSGLVVCYAEMTRPRSTWGFWKRRYVQLGVPFVAWTCIYVVYTILSSNVGWNQFGTVLWYDLRYGFYQLYVVIVLFQFYLIFPLLLWLLRSTKHHALIFAISVAVAVFIGVVLHYNPHLGVVGHDVHEIGHAWPWGRNLLSYQMYFLAGVLIALHIEQMHAFVQKWHRWILAASVAVGVATLLWYLSEIWGGASTGSAGDIFEPIAVVWGLAATTGIFALSWMWLQRRSAARNGGTPARWFSITRLAELTGGIFLCHVLFINLIRSALYSKFVGGAHLPWPIIVLVFYVGTLSIAVAFVSVIVRTPLRWVLGGPVRAEQRKEIDSASIAPAGRLNGRVADRGDGSGFSDARPADEFDPAAAGVAAPVAAPAVASQATGP